MYQFATCFLLRMKWTYLLQARSKTLLLLNGNRLDKPTTSSASATTCFTYAFWYITQNTFTSKITTGSMLCLYLTALNHWMQGQFGYWLVFCIRHCMSCCSSWLAVQSATSPIPWTIWTWYILAQALATGICNLRGIHSTSIAKYWWLS